MKKKIMLVSLAIIGTVLLTGCGNAKLKMVKTLQLQ